MLFIENHGETRVKDLVAFKEQLFSVITIILVAKFFGQILNEETSVPWNITVKTLRIRSSFQNEAFYTRCTSILVAIETSDFFSDQQAESKTANRALLWHSKKNWSKNELDMNYTLRIERWSYSFSIFFTNWKHSLVVQYFPSFHFFFHFFKSWSKSMHCRCVSSGLQTWWPMTRGLVKIS